MKINQSGEIDNSIKFDDSTDILKRKNFGVALGNLIINSENQSLVISINAQWGEGKTDFLKRFNNYLKDERDLNSIYFNSFKNDYIEDPFIALLGEILKSFKGEGIRTEILEKGKNILKGIIPLAGKVGARWIMKGDNEQVDDDFEKLIEGDLANSIFKKLDEYSKKETELDDFRKTLEGIIEKEGKQLVFIIDELDRCRPDFALRLLERIKHFFDIKGLYFVLGINKVQIEKYIERIYGNIDSKVYLQKFIDIETILLKNIDYNENDIKKYIDYLLKINSSIFSEKNDLKRMESLKNILLFLSDNFNLSLREIEKIVNYIILFRKTLGERSLYFYSFILILIFIKLFDEDTYAKIRNGKISKGELLDLPYMSSLDTTSSYFEYIDSELDFFLTEELSIEFLNEYSYIIQYGLHTDYESRKGFLKHHINTLENFNI